MVHPIYAPVPHVTLLLPDMLSRSGKYPQMDDIYAHSGSIPDRAYRD